MIVQYSVSKNWFDGENFTLVNIWIFPAASDFEHLEGLCGNYNGDWADDLQYPNGFISFASPYEYWNTYDDFIQSWE